MFPCLLGDAYSAVWLLSVIFQHLTVVGLRCRANRRNSLSLLHLKLHLMLPNPLILFLAVLVAGTVPLLFQLIILQTMELEIGMALFT